MARRLKKRGLASKEESRCEVASEEAPQALKRQCNGASGAEGDGCSGRHGGANSPEGESCVGKDLSMEERKRAAQKIMERNCFERLGLTWALFLDKFKSSSEEEKKKLWDSVK